MSILDRFKLLIGLKQKVGEEPAESPASLNEISDRARQAVAIDEENRIYISSFDTVDAEKLASAFKECWERIPDVARTQLVNHWQELRKKWESRQPKCEIRLPIIGVFSDVAEVAREQGAIFGHLLNARSWNGYRESFDDIEREFASTHLVVDYSQFTPATLDVDEIASSIANYSICLEKNSDHSDFTMFDSFGNHHDLAESWGFFGGE